jgi:DNA-binding transcriptional LysR family regulator
MAGSKDMGQSGARMDALSRHRLPGFTTPTSLNIWPLPQQGGDGWPVTPVIAASSGETLRHLALAGGGVFYRQEVLAPRVCALVNFLVQGLTGAL